jgi:deoxycytidine triphosphate deaminase
VATILADKDIRKLIGSVLIGADENRINPNGIELRLGKQVHFHSTGEEKELGPGLFLRVSPGETVSISSIEQIDFTAPVVQAILPNAMLMGFITPTTTMMREGISQVTTKIDAGFRGVLNWGLRNGSTKDLILQYGEPIFKLTLFVLENDEVPETPYGERTADYYQNTAGIKRSARRLPADIPKAKIVSSSFDQLDPKKQLREAGYPFDHIGTELTALQGKFEVVSKDVLLLKDQFERTTNELSGKIEAETRTLSEKVEELRKSILERVEALFDRKFLRVGGIVFGAIPIMYGGVTYLQGTGLGGNVVAFIAMSVGVLILLLTYALSRRGQSQ